MSLLLDVLSIGEILVDIVSDSAPPTHSWGFRAHPGGAPANVAVGVARLGGKAGFLGALSRDAFGAWLRTVLERERVEHQHCPTCDKPTTLAFVTLDATGDRSFSFYRQATSDTFLRPKDIEGVPLERARAVHVCSVSLTESPAREATLGAVRRARAAGVFVSFDVNLRPMLWRDLSDAKDLVRRVIDESNLVKMSREELLFLQPDGDLSRLVAQSDPQHRKLWVVTSGSGVTHYVYGALKGHVDAFQVEAVDTTGAGDAFVAALLVHLVDQNFDVKTEQQVRDALRFAHAAASLCVQRPGAIPALPTLSEVMEFLQMRIGR